MKRVVYSMLLGAVFATVAPTVFATSHNGSKSSQSSAHLSTGEVRKIDRNAGKITIRHGPLANLDMPAMTMVFQVNDRALLDRVKIGDRIHFLAEKVQGTFTVTRLESAK